MYDSAPGRSAKSYCLFFAGAAYMRGLKNSSYITVRTIDARKSKKAKRKKPARKV
jgi:hypothetical protein